MKIYVCEVLYGWMARKNHGQVFQEKLNLPDQQKNKEDKQDASQGFGGQAGK